MQKATGRVSALASKVSSADENTTTFSTGIAHTRWATHGGVTVDNTHPHRCSSGRFYIVHNGIIENYKELKADLQSKYSFYSDTDTEIVVKLIEQHYDGNLKSTLEIVSQKLVGAYSIAVIDAENPGIMVGIKLGSPLVVGSARDGVYISSDVNALASLADNFAILEDHEMVVIEDGKYNIYMAGKQIDRATEDVQESHKIDELGDFSTYTEKEIHDIPTVLENVFRGRMHFEDKSIRSDTLDKLRDLDVERMYIIAS